MYKKMILAFAVASMFSATPALAWGQRDVADVEVVPDVVCDKNYDNCKAVWRYTVFSLEDGLIVKGVVVNNGRCAVKTNRFGRLLQEDDYADFTVTTEETYRRCRPHTVDLHTNKGDFVYDFDDDY